MIFFGSLFSSIADLVKTWLTGFNAKQKAKNDIRLAEMENTARLLREKESNNHAWEMAALVDKDRWLRRISFMMFASPFLVALFAPEHVKYYFEIAISNVPLWWQKTFMAITGGIWGLGSLKNMLPSVIDAFRKK